MLRAMAVLTDMSSALTANLGNLSAAELALAPADNFQNEFHIVTPT